MPTLAAATAAALIAVTGVGHAAELASAPSVPRLGTCGNGSGGFLVPGSDACLTIGGFVRGEGRWTLASPRLVPAALARSATPLPVAAGTSLTQPALGASARLTADMHIPTELGPARIFVSLRGHNGLLTDRAAR